MTDGVRSTSLPAVSAVDEVMANQRQDGIFRTVRVPVASLKAQLAGDGSLSASVVKATLADLTLVAGEFDEGDVGLVVADGASNGRYRKTGLIWAFQGILPEDAAELAQAGAEAAEDGAVAARDLAAGYASAAVSQGNVPIYSTHSGFSVLAVPAGIIAARLNGYYAVGDGGEKLIKRVVSAPAAGGVRSADRFLPDGSTNAGNGGWWQIAEELPNVLQFGAKDDGVTDGYAAFAEAKTFLGSTGKRLHLPFHNTGVYYANPASGTFDFRGITVSTDKGVQLKGHPRFDDEIQVIDDIPVQYDDGTMVYNNFLLTKDHGRLPHLKENFIHEVERKLLIPLDFNAFSPVKLLFAAGDTWAADATMNTLADTASVNLAADDYMHAIFAPVRGGDEMEVSFDSGSFIKAAIVRFVGGYMAFFAGVGFATFRTKLTGVAASDTAGLQWFGASSDPAWGPTKAVWKIRIYNANRFAIMLNGMQLFDATTPGPIVDAGFGIHYLATAILASMTYWTKTRRTQAYGHSPARLFIAGDSTSSSQLGSWEHYCKELLDGTHGMRVWDVFNQAVAGQTSADQLALMNTNVAQLGISTHLVIFIGINDNMAGGPAAALTNVENMILLANANGFGDNGRITLVIPHIWYTQAMAGGIGFNAGSNSGHGPYRAGLKKLAARRGCRIVDLTEVLAAITPTDLTRVDDVYPLLRDNIHETNYAYKVVGEAIAREIVAGSSIEMTPAEGRTLFAASQFENAWTPHAGREPWYMVSKDRVVQLGGLVDKGTWGEPKTILTLPVNLRPPKTMELPARTSTGSVSIVYAGDDTDNGGIIVSGFPNVGGTYLSLDNISFQLA